VEGMPVDLACTRCPLSKGRTQVVAGEGPSPCRLVIVGEAPGEREDLEGRPFVGRAGAILDVALKAGGVSRREALITNVVKCRPPGNRRPTREEIEACRPFLEWEVARAGAPVVVALGSTAAKAVLGRSVKVSEVKAAAGRAEIGGAPREVFVTLHPASSRFRKGAREQIAGVLQAAASRAGLLRPKGPAQARL